MSAQKCLRLFFKLILTSLVMESGGTAIHQYPKQPSAAQPSHSDQSNMMPAFPDARSSSNGAYFFREDVVKEPQFLTQAQKIEVTLGDNAILPCKLANLGDYVVVWKQGDRVISAGPIQVRKDYRFALVEPASLSITEVDVKDSGNYTCEVEWQGKPRNITHELVVQVPPSIWAVLPGGMGQINKPIEVREGSSIQLQCQAEGIPTPEIFWRRPNGDYLGSGRPQGPVLHIPEVRKEHSGTYMCTASNKVGSISADQIELRVQYPPEVSSADRTVYSGPGGRADLKCIVKAEPKANITWFLDGRRVHLDRRHHFEEHGILAALRIMDVDTLDLGNYSCQAENSQGVARDHIELSGKPQIATISSSPEGSYKNSYNLTWSVSSVEPLLKVRILYRKMDRTTIYYENNTWTNLLLSMQDPKDLGLNSNLNPWIASSSSSYSDIQSHHRPRRDYRIHHHLFQNLDPNSRYEIIIQSQNRFGWSEPTKSFIFSTRLRDPPTISGFHGNLISAAGPMMTACPGLICRMLLPFLLLFLSWPGPLNPGIPDYTS